MEGVLLVNMPFAGVDRPPLGIGNLKAILHTRGIPCDIKNFNVAFAEQVGPHFYEALSEYLSHTVLIGEWLFAQHLFSDRLPSAQAYYDYIQREHQVDPGLLESLPWLASLIGPFLDYCLRSVDWSRYDIVGFTSMFEQNMASLALASTVKHHDPEKIIVFGGANCEDRMGLGLHRSFPFIDYVISGEADDNFPAVVSSLAGRQSVTGIPGLVYRDGRRSIATPPSHGVADMDALPFPDFRDYFVEIERTTVPWLVPQKLQMETSRGCWWGAKHHCTFCGLNPDTIHFRAKSKDRALAELVHFAENYPVKEIATVDNIIDMRYFRDLLPELRRRQLSLRLFYETKANLTRDQVRLLRAAGINWIQPGIESLHHRILQLMRKGVTPLQNVQLLKWCRELGVAASWNLLYGFPGESPADYQEMLPLLRALTHLQPPDATGKIRLDRFSPYFRDPHGFGMIDVRPMRSYRFIYPVPEADLRDIAYFFDYDYADGLDPESYIGPVERQIAHWREEHYRGAFLQAYAATPDLLVLTDTRPATPRTYRLESWRKPLYEFCDQVRSFSAIQRFYEGQDPASAGAASSSLRAFLDDMVSAHLMARDADHYLSLACSKTS